MISVIVAAYNVERYIEDCVNSILAQTCPDIELIVVDDGSTDATGARCRALLEGRANARCVRQDNAGAGAARNHGMRLARGEWILFVDGDDQVEPQLAERLLAAADAETDIVCCGFTAFSDDTGLCVQRQFLTAPCEMRGPAEKEVLLLQLMTPGLGQPPGKKYSSVGVPWGKLYRAEALRAHGIEFPTLKRMQDNVFNMYAFTHARKIVYLDACLYRYRHDHIRGYSVSAPLRYAVLEARDRYFAEFDALVTPRMREELYREKLRYFGASLKLECAGCGFSEARRRARALCEQEIYARMLRERSGRPPEARYRLIRWLGRAKLYAALALISRARAGRKDGTA